MPDQELEIVVSAQSGYADASGAPLAKAKAALDSLGKNLADSLEPLRSRLTGFPSAPDELEISLALAFQGEAKWVVISLGSEATVGIKATWKRK
jgi:hypothetical protein